MGFNPIDHRHVRVVLKFLEMPPYQIAKFIDSGIRTVNLLSETGKYLSGFITEELNQDILFIFEIKINGTIGNTGLLCDLGNR
jgi:hypothetical protein